MNKIRYVINNSHLGNILDHLNECNNNFVPPLSERVDLEKYAAKIYNKAVKFEAWEAHELIGLLAAYINLENNKMFITNVSVCKKNTNNGIAKKLIENSIDYCNELKIKEINLEVKSSNHKALSLYNQFNFQIEKSIDESLFLSLKIKYGK